MSEWRVSTDRAVARGSSESEAGVAAVGKQTLAEQHAAVALIVDGHASAPGQMAKAAFLDQLHGMVVAAASAELAPQRADSCPYIEQYFARYRQAPAADVAALIARFAPASRGARTASELFEPLIARIRQGIQQWRASGKLPGDLEAAAPGAASAAAGKPTLRSLEHELGPGTKLDGGTASKLSGGAVTQAKIHTGPEAAKKAAEVDAKAFAVGDNVVFGAGTYQPGTLAGDALLAHELAHVAQQQDAARDPAAKDHPIGGEAAAPEAAADGRATRTMLQLHGNQGARKASWDDVMTTGLQLQRCSGDSWPAGPPLTGKQADEKIGEVPLIADYIHNDIQRGLTGEKLVRLFPDAESYAKALAAEVGTLQMVPPEHRLEAAREFAAHAKGFTDPATRKVYIQTDGVPAFVTIHEMMHVYTSDRHLTGTGGLGQHFVEGVADYFTRMICIKNGMPFKSAYAGELKAVEALAAQLGDTELANLTFHGDIEAGQKILDSKGAGTWKAYQKQMRSDDYEHAADLLGGVKEANAARVAKEEADAEKANAAARAKQDAADAKDRETWPPEGKAPVQAPRILSKTVHGTMAHLMVAAGGNQGVRETWTAQLKLSNGRVMTARVVKVLRRVSYIEIDEKLADLVTEPIELRPKP